MRQRLILLALGAVVIRAVFIHWAESRLRAQASTRPTSEKVNMDETMEFTWTIPSSSLRQMLDDVYNHVMNPEEMMEWLFLTSNRQYFATDINTGQAVPIPEEVHFQLRKQNEDANLFKDVELDDDE